MVKSSSKKGTRPKDRTGQRFRCFRVIRTIPKVPGGRYHVLKCSNCGATNNSQWNETTKAFSPLPCDCGDLRISNLKVGDIRNNKEILKIEMRFVRGFRQYKVDVRCLNCGSKSTITNINVLKGHAGKPNLWCEHCKGDALRVDHSGEKIGTWKIISEDNQYMTCRCIRCRYQIVLLRKHINTLKKRLCPECLEAKKTVDRNKIIVLLFWGGYSYNAIGDYFGITAGTVRDIVKRMAVRYEGPV